MGELVQWLTALPLSLTIRRVSWVIPLMQTIHILATGMILSSVIMIDLRIWGVSQSQTLAQSARRFVPWIWSAMVLLIITGLALIIAAPRRTLLDSTFQVKMALMIVAIAATLALQVGVRHKPPSPDHGSGGVVAGVAAAATLILWIAVTVAGRGRWIGNVIPHLMQAR